MIERIDHLNIVVSDLERTKEFFFLLGFTEGIRSELDAQFLERLTGIEGARGRFVSLHLPGSGTAVELLQFDGGVIPDGDIGKADRIGFRHLAFAVNDIESTVSRLREAGVEFLSPVQTRTKTGKKLVYFRGPDGILMELAEYSNHQAFYSQPPPLPKPLPFDALLPGSIIPSRVWFGMSGRSYER